MNLRTEIGLGAIYMGTVIGAGFATGQEIMSFFTVYGKQGLLGIALASALFFLLGYLVLLQSIRKQSQCLRDILLPLAGERLTLAFELMADVFCLAGYCIMLSGCGAVLEESWNLNYTMTIFLLSVFLIWCLSRELSGLAAANKLLLSVILALTIVIGSACISDRQGISETSLQGEKGSWLMSSLLYVSYNGTLALVVLSSLGSYTDRVGAALGGAAIGALGIMLMAGLMWFITWVNYPGLYGAQVPLLQVARPLGNLLFLSSVIVLLAAMITTALGLGFAFARSVSKRFGLSYKRAIYFLLIGIPLAKYNFAALINTIYPFFGKLGIIFAIFLAIKQVFKHENRMI
ncbi:MAG: hypothetical protein WBJ82_10685 [Tepidanaerobacteraceae bacterium]|nr:hypothetical protein [Tepidanaerobacteraceae bacterium]HQE04731.1 hypothetical protein [Tepidanaerobacteraceae bacterium]